MTPDPSRRPSNLARAARANPEPVYLQTGRFAPPDTRAVWHLPCRYGLLQLQWREQDDSVTLRILDGEEGGAL